MVNIVLILIVLKAQILSGKRWKQHFQVSKFQNFLGACPQTPLGSSRPRKVGCHLLSQWRCLLQNFLTALLCCCCSTLLFFVVVGLQCRCSWKFQRSEALKWSCNRSHLSRNRERCFPLIYANTYVYCMSVVITLVNSMVGWSSM